MPQRRIQTIDRIYAQALLNISLELQALDQVESDYKTLLIEIAGNEKFAAFLASPRIPVDLREASLKKLFEAAMQPLLLQFLLVLNRRRRLGRLQTIFNAWRTLRDQHEGRVFGEIATAHLMDDEQVESIRASVAKWMGKDVKLRQEVQPALIGGIRLRLEDELIDGSIASKLRHARRKLLDAGRTEARNMAARLPDDDPTPTPGSTPGTAPGSTPGSSPG